MTMTIAAFSSWLIEDARQYLSFDCRFVFYEKYFHNAVLKDVYIEHFLNYRGSASGLFDEIQHEFDITGNITIFESEV